MKKKTQGAPAPNYVKWLWYAALTPFVLLAAMLTLTALGAFGRMPSFEELENPRSNIATEIYSEDGKVLGTFFVQNRSYVQYEELFASDSVTRTSINGREVPPIVAALIATEDARFEDVLAELERERRRVEQMKEEAQRMRSAAQSERDKMRAERDAAEDRVDKMMESARGQADNILKNARMTAETVFDELETLKKKAQKKNADQNLAAAKAALRGVITQTENEQRRGIQKRVVEADEVRPVQKGDRVRLLNVGGVIATVLAPADRDGSVQVQAGPMKMTVKENELRLVEEKKNAPKPKPQPRRDAPRRELNIRSAESEVDVRGMSAEEALFEVDNFLSRAIMAGLPSVTVIHGKGTGVLRTAVQQHLRRNKRVKSVRSGVYGEGEQGVTIVELR